MPLDVKAAVADALLELIRRKDADKITVKDLVEVCGISRQTFYYHFKDIVDVVAAFRLSRTSRWTPC